MYVFIHVSLAQFLWVMGKVLNDYCYDSNDSYKHRDMGY